MKKITINFIFQIIILLNAIAFISNNKVLDDNDYSFKAIYH